VTGTKRTNAACAHAVSTLCVAQPSVSAQIDWRWSPRHFNHDFSIHRYLRQDISASAIESNLDAVATYGVSVVQYNMACAGLFSLPDEVPADLATRIGVAGVARGIRICTQCRVLRSCSPGIRHVYRIPHEMCWTIHPWQCAQRARTTCTHLGRVRIVPGPLALMCRDCGQP
jgi:hypothetical protein